MASISSHGSSPQPHVVLFPFMAESHTTPLLLFSRFLLHRHMAVTIITTHANRPFIADSLHDTAASIIDLPFPYNIDGDIPAGVESTDKLPSISLFYKFALATAAMQPHFEETLHTLPPVSFIISDAFHWWTLQSASKFDIPRFVYYGMSCYTQALCSEGFLSGILRGSHPDDELVSLTRFPWIKLCKNYFAPEFRNPDPSSLVHEFNTKVFSTLQSSYGILVNSFYELEPVFVDYVNNESSSPKCWCVGPFCLAEQLPNPCREVIPTWVLWLDEKLERKQSVLYVAFGSQAEISAEQLKEIATGLEESMVNFLWVIRKTEREWALPNGFEERVKKRGIVVREWVEQGEILMHKSVQGFLSHCEWNSVLESICAEVPILAWPLMAEQHLNAKMVEEEIKVGLRVETCNGSVRGFVKWEELRNKVKELMEGEKGREAKKKEKEFAEMAKKAVQEGGSSCSTLDSLIEETCYKKKTSLV